MVGFTSSSSDSSSEDEDDQPKGKYVRAPRSIPTPPPETEEVFPDLDEDKEDSTKITEDEFKPKHKENTEEEIVLDPTPTSHKPSGLTPVFVQRSEQISEARSRLPIIAEEQLIMERISEHGVVVLSGETGSGKTTQLPQFLYEAGYASQGRMIGKTWICSPSPN